MRNVLHRSQMLECVGTRIDTSNTARESEGEDVRGSAFS